MRVSTPLLLVALGCFFLSASRPVVAEPKIPAPLQPWQEWATWDVKDLDGPRPFNDASQRISLWPSRLHLAVNDAGATFQFEVTTTAETWLELPGEAELWPVEVMVNGIPAPILERAERPALLLSTGHWKVTGAFRWKEMPQRIRVPRAVGLLSLVLKDQLVAIPNWDDEGFVWLQRTRPEEADRDSLTFQVYRVLEDGIPLQLQTEIELSVSGRSREEVIGHILPEGWKLARITSQIPVAADEQGLIKAQVRAGKWVIAIEAFRSSPATEIRFAEGMKPATATEFIGFRAKPEFRMVDLAGIRAIDVSQTTFPEKWRSLPVYLWETSAPFRIEERMRGMGLQRPPGLKMMREFWLDETGGEMTFRDVISGGAQQIWRLDAAPGQELGAARIAGQAQLITYNPQTGEPGVEIRSRELQLEAVGKTRAISAIPITGWRSDADSVHATINLPPGWRLLTAFGADRVQGDWVTAWSLFDLFVLMIFAVAVFRVAGPLPGLLALAAFALSYHEPSAPRFAWFFLLLPLALLKYVKAGGVQPWLVWWKRAAVAVLILRLTPFLALQVQGILYPQLESQGSGARGAETMDAVSGIADPRSPASDYLARQVLPSSSSDENFPGKKAAKANLSYDAQARIQTGPAIPAWSWNRVSFSWDGPVAAGQTVRPIFISLGQHRLIGVLRVLLVIALAFLLIGVRFSRWWKSKTPAVGSTAAAAAVAFLLTLGVGDLHAQGVPDAATLKTLRERLLAAPDAFPKAADIPFVRLSLQENRLAMEVTIHTGAACAVPLPGQLPDWSPVTVTVARTTNEPTAVRRKDGQLWILLPKGIHQVRVEGLLPNPTEWGWHFLLKPRRVEIDAPGWTVTGLSANGEPEAQVFFARKLESSEAEAAYDRKDFSPSLILDRKIEAGLVWKVVNTVSRLGAGGRAVALRVPLLPGEKVLSANAQVGEGFVEVRLGAGDASVSWESELPIVPTLELTAEPQGLWVERWTVETSQIWNIALAGLEPVFSDQSSLVPTWHPWPGEKVALSFTRPEAAPGTTLTIRRVKHGTEVGARQQIAWLELTIETSLGGDFPLELPPGAEVSEVSVSGKSIPVRKSGEALMLTLQPGVQEIVVNWRLKRSLETVFQMPTVKLPVEAANVTSHIRLPDERWVLWTDGPLRGPAVRFWTILAAALLTALILSSLRFSPAGWATWMVLAIGLVPAHYLLGLIMVGWFVLLSWRGSLDLRKILPGRAGPLQVVIVMASIIAGFTLLFVVGDGLLGKPEMYIRGNGSSATLLQWYAPKSGLILPQPSVFSLSIWFYRLAMLAWALWLAVAVTYWLKWAWLQFTHGGAWPKKPVLAPLPRAANPSASEKAAVETAPTEAHPPQTRSTPPPIPD